MSSPATLKTTSNRTIRRYRINPLELVIFTLVTVGFGYSVFHLFRDSGDLQFATLQPMQTQPTRMIPETTKGATRAIATISGAADGVAPMPNTINFEVNCAENPGFQFGGKICPNQPTTGRVFNDDTRSNPAKIR